MKKRFIDLLSQHQLFVVPFLIFLAFAFCMEAIFPKADLFLLTNQYHSPFFDSFFQIETHLGDGKMLLFVGICLALVKYRYSLLTLIAFAYASVITQILKRIFHAPRPSKFFEDLYEIRTIPGLKIHEWNSFPSGHSVSAFTLAVILMHIIRYKYRGVIIFPLALLTIFSRTYLAQHFFQDIVAGSILGTVLTFQVIWWLENSSWYHSPKLDGRLRLFQRHKQANNEQNAK